MSISAAHLSSTPPVGSPLAAQADLRSRYALIVLAAFALLTTLATAFDVLRNPAYSSYAIYGLASLTFLAAALSQLILLPSKGSITLRIRWYLWVGFLLLHAFGLALASLYHKHLIQDPTTLKHVLFSLSYALAYIVTVNPPRSTAWRRLWLVDAILACVMSTIFFLVYRSGEPAGVYTSLLFAIATQVIFALGSLLSLHTAESVHARDLARYMLVYFIFSVFAACMTDLPRIWPRVSTAFAGDLLYSFPILALALAPLFLQASFAKRLSLGPSKTRPLPPAAPVLITSAILLACLPLLHFNVVTGIALLVVAVGLFTMKVALMQTDFEQERTSLLQNNKQLRELAYIDPITGIANRRKFMEVADTALQKARRGLEPHWLVLIEIENLRSIFASSGRRAGELSLCEFVQLVSPTLEPSTTHFAHLANGEFALLLKRVNQQTIELTVQHVRDALHTSRLRIATGAALATSSGPDTVERWLANAGTVLHRNRAFELHANP